MKDFATLMKKETTTQKNADQAQGGALLGGRALAVGASVCVVEKHSDVLNREQVGRVWNSAHATDLYKTVANLEGWVFALSTDEICDGWLRASNQFGDARLRVSSPFNQKQICGPSGWGIFGQVCASESDSLFDNVDEVKAREPFTHEPVFCVLNAPINECCFCTLYINRACNDFVAYKAHSQASNTIFVCGNTGCRVYSSADLYVPVAEQADVEILHLSRLLTFCGSCCLCVELVQKSLESYVALGHDIANLAAFDLGNRGLWDAGLLGNVYLSKPVGSDRVEKFFCCAHKYSLWTILTQLLRICNED